ncbi:hypothetical protein ACFFUB_05845 [Algimonas porphyrae]|nr:hypothetical protein [Algimonas porphyrae]
MKPSRGVIRSAAIWGVLIAPFLAVPASAETLGDYRPDVMCSVDFQESDSGPTYCTRDGAARKRILEAAEHARDIWLIVRSPKARLSLLAVSGRYQISPLSSDEIRALPMGAKWRQQRSETPVFIDPVSGAIHIDASAMPHDLASPDQSLDIGLERNLGLALMRGYPSLGEALSSPGRNDLIVTQMEAIASFPSLVTASPDDIPSGIAVSRDFTQPLFDTGPGWANAEFWKQAFEASRTQAALKSKDYFTAIFTALGAAADEGRAQPTQLFEMMDIVFRDDLGWARFDGDGFGRAYATAMAAHQLDEETFMSDSEDVTLKAEAHLAKEVGVSALDPLTSKFLDLEIAGSKLRETELAITICEIAGADCIATDKVRLLFEGQAIDARAGLRTYPSRNGDLVTVTGSNRIQMTLPSRRANFGGDDKQFFGLKLGVSNLTPDDTVAYRMTISLVVREASCEWSAMAATMNPWWRGDLDGPGSLTPDLQDMPADIRMEISQGLRDSWILTQDDYWTEIGLDEQVFRDGMNEHELRLHVPDDWDVTTVPQIWQNAPKKGDLARYFSRLMPSAAEATLSGSVTDSGTVCVSPVATSALMDMSVLSEAAPDEMLRQMALPEELLNESDDGMDEFEGMAAILRNMATDDGHPQNNPNATLILQIFSPNLFTQQMGLIPSGAMVPLSHSGFDGWRKNAGFNIYVRIPDVAPQDFISGQFPIEGLVLPAIGDEDIEPSDYPPFYMWGEASGDDIKFEDYIAPKLTGTITISKRVEGAAIASLEMSGNTYRRDGHDTSGTGPDVTSVGTTTIKIDRMFLLGLSEGEPLPVLNMFDLTTARLQ